MEGRNGPRAGTLTARASIKSIFGSEAPPNGRYRPAKGISAELLLHVLPEWGIGMRQVSGNFGGIDQELRLGQP